MEGTAAKVCMMTCFLFEIGVLACYQIKPRMSNGLEHTFPDKRALGCAYSCVRLPIEYDECGAS